MDESILQICILILFIITGIIFGRFIICKICPFGYLQDWLFKIPSPFKRKSLKGDKYWRSLKYIALGLQLIMGLVLGFGNNDTESGPQTAKLASFIILSFVFIILQRPFCKYLCPVGALFSLCNLISPYRYKVNTDKCTKCKKCTKKCKMDISVYKVPNHLECIRCKSCINACPYKAIETTYRIGLSSSKKE
ncbi:4Fe-4S binding protein [termite gut metagenome]|uniref:4Fe-4S binding protein n=1 Tax=termite gut metagenome TaxID=433724 RepID=A0A5J4QBT1_9ZZZZ